MSQIPVLREVPCPLCGVHKDKTLYVRRAESDAAAFAAEMTTDRFVAYGRIARCRDCGMVYRNPREDDAAVLGAYAAMEDAEYLTEQECRGMNALLSLRTLKRHAKAGKLLEVGCSTGFFLNAARMDFDVQGVEPSAWAVRFAREKLKLDVLEGALETAPLAPASFDAVALVDVIEHLTDPLAALQRCAALLKPGGVLYLVTPDADSLSAKVLRSRWWALRPAHLAYFSERTLSRLLAKAGFRVAECRSYGRMFTLGYWLSRLRGYPAPIRFLGRVFVAFFGGEDKVVYINTRDSLEICAVRT